MKRLNHILHFDHLDLLGIALALFVTSLRIYWIALLLIIFLFKARNHICWLLFWIGTSIIFMLYMTTQQDFITTKIRDEVTVIAISKRDYSDRLLVRHKAKKYYIYTNHDEYKMGDQLFVSGKVQHYTKATRPYGFDAQAYYRSQNIFGIVQVDKIEKIQSRFHINHFRQFLMDKYHAYNVSPWVMLMLFGEPLDHETKENFEMLGMLHLISASGIHLFTVAFLFKKMCFYLNVPTKTQTYIIIGFYGFMCYMHQLDIGILRLLLMALVSHMNHQYELRRSRLEIIQFVFFLLLITHVRHIYYSSLGITYLIITLLALTEPIYRKGQRMKRQITMTLFVLFLLIPFQNKINLMTIIILPIVSVMFAGLLMIGSWLVLIVPKTNDLFQLITDIINQLFENMINPKLIIIFGKRSVIWQVIYLISFCYLIVCRGGVKRTLSLIVMMSSIFIPTIIQKQQTTITFLDVGQGDATVITSKGCVVVIDAFQGVSDYLMDLGYHQIDYLILTHSDIDHTKEAVELLEKHHVSSLVISAFDRDYPSYQSRIQKVKAGDIITCNQIKLHVLAPFRESSSQNNASIVIQTTLLQQTFLLTGDIEFEVEEELVHTYGHSLKSDVLKVAHHGSSTSTSSYFLHYVKPKISIISVGRNNRYNFPNSEVIHRIRKINAIIYRTDLDGSIICMKDKKKVKWQLHLPF